MRAAFLFISLFFCLIFSADMMTVAAFFDLLTVCMNVRKVASVAALSGPIFT